MADVDARHRFTDEQDSLRRQRQLFVELADLPAEGHLKNLAH
jgi:hypothetical protein